MTLSVDLRKRVILAVDDGEDITKVAQTFKVSEKNNILLAEFEKQGK